jgi:hypothetical protein
MQNVTDCSADNGFIFATVVNAYTLGQQGSPFSNVATGSASVWVSRTLRQPDRHSDRHARPVCIIAVPVSRSPIIAPLKIVTIWQTLLSAVAFIFCRRIAFGLKLVLHE